MTNEVNEVVEVAEEAVVEEMKGTNAVRIAEDIGLVTGAGLAIYGLYKLLEKPVKTGWKWITNKFSKKNKDTDSNNEQQTQDESK